MSDFYSKPSKKRRRRVFQFESLEHRDLFARSDSAFANIGSLTFSFPPDGTPIASHQNQLFSGLSELGSSSDWQGAILRAFQKWATHSSVNFGVTTDNGEAIGVYGPTKGDSRFGDIRISGFDYNTDTFAEAVSGLTHSVGTWAGDLIFNTQADWQNIQMFESAALHEMGHILGLGHSSNPLSPMHTHGGNGVIDLIAEDIALLQSLHGARHADPGDAGNGNNSIDRASVIKGDVDDVGSQEGFNGSQVWIQFGDLTTASDRDVYEIKTSLGYQGPIAVEVRSSGLSLAKVKASITDRNGNVLASGSINAAFGGSLVMQLAQTSPEAKYYIHVEPSSDPFWAVGDYAITIASPEQLSQSASSIVAWLNQAHRWYYDSNQSKNGYSWQLSNQGTLQPNFDSENHVDDRSDHARLLTPSLITSARTVYQYLGAISDLTDVDHFKIVSPRVASTSLEMTVDVESLLPGGLIPAVEILDKNGNHLDAETRVNGYGQLQVVRTNVELNREYVIRLKTASASVAHKTGNFSLTVTFSEPSVSNALVLTGTLSSTNSVEEREWYVARPQLFSMNLQGFSAAPSVDAQVWVNVFNERRVVVAGFVAPVGELRSSPGILLDPGTYYLQVAFAQNGASPLAVPYKLTIDQPSSPIGPLLGTTGAAPRFLCPGETNIYCYPDSPTPTTQTTRLGNPPVVSLPLPATTPTIAPNDLWFWENIFLPTNPTNPLDASGDLLVTPLDALLIINRLNLVGVGAYPPAPASIGFLDTSRDGLITPIDVLLVINYLNLRV